MIPYRKEMTTLEQSAEGGAQHRMKGKTSALIQPASGMQRPLPPRGSGRFDQIASSLRRPLGSRRKSTSEVTNAAGKLASSYTMR